MSLYKETSDLLKDCKLTRPYIAKELECSITYLITVEAMTGDTGILKLTKLNKWLKAEKKHRAKQKECKK